MTRPIVIGHRGNAGTAPANTLAGFKEAIEVGADLIELDLRISEDGKTVLIHDAVVDHTTNGTGRVDSMTFRELRELDAGTWKSPEYRNEKIPTFQEAIDLIKGKAHLAVDLKTAQAIPLMIKQINENNIREQVVVIGCDLQLALLVREADPRLSVTLNMDAELCELAKKDFPLFIFEYTKRAAENQLAALCINYNYVSPELVYTAHLRGLPVWAWTIDNTIDIRKILDFGADAIISNYPSRVMEEVK